MTDQNAFNAGLTQAAQQHSQNSNVDLEKYFRERNTPAPVVPYEPPVEVETVCIIEWAGATAIKLIRPVSGLAALAVVVAAWIWVGALAVAFVAANWAWFAGGAIAVGLLSGARRGGSAGTGSTPTAGGSQNINVTVNIVGGNGSVTTNTK